MGPITMMLSTLKHMRHYIRTIHGTSDRLYTANDFPHFHDVGQGNGAAPAIWAAVSSLLLNLQRSLGFGASFQSPLSTDEIRIAGFAFVDDTDLLQTAGQYATPAELLHQTQRCLDTWSASLRITGGALVPAKSFWTLITFNWKDGRWSYATQDNQPGTLLMTAADGQRLPKERIDAAQGRRTLGVRIAPDGNNRAEVLYLRRCSEEWADRVRTGHLPRHLAWRALSAMLWPKLLYPLAATTLTRSECNYIMAPALWAGLSASGVVNTFPRAIVYSITNTLGLAIPHLYDAQGWQQITIAIRHGSDPQSITGRLIR